jgi:hypothetical protein
MGMDPDENMLSVSKLIYRMVKEKNFTIKAFFEENQDPFFK